MARLIVLFTVLVFGGATISSTAVAQSKWRKVNMGWKVSCGVDAGAIKKKGKSYTFSTSSNHCKSRGTFTQRAEIYGSDIKVNQPMNYLFSTTLRFDSTVKKDFTLFQIHDGRLSCAPPLKLDWRADNRMGFYSSYSLDKGVHDCVENRKMISERFSGPRLKRDGTAYDLKILLEFDGASGFETTVFLDGVKVLSGEYDPPTDPRFFKSSKFYMKHGSYSRDVWSYRLTSTDISVFRQKP